MVIATIPTLVLIIGALLYAFAGNAKLSEVGRIMFFAGLLAALLATHGGSVHVP